MALGEAAAVGHSSGAHTKATSNDEVVEGSSGSGRSGVPRNMAWTTTRESFSTAFEYQISSEPPSPLQEAIDNKRKLVEEPFRGRTLARLPRYEDPLSRTSQSQSRSSIEVTTTRIGKRINRSSTFHDDPTSPLAMLDDDMLEPCPHISSCAIVSEVLRPITLGDPMNIDIAKDSQMQAVMQQKLLSKAQVLPAEILEQIYHHLCASDFYAARHTCRDWFIKSMERGLLETMCKRSGIASSILKELAFQRTQSPSIIPTNEDWLISKRLSRESTLGGHWKGNGVDQFSKQGSPFLRARSVEFVDQGTQFNPSELNDTTYTVSTCGHFLVTAKGCLVYVYELRSTAASNGATSHSNLRPVTSIICPKTVIACSMDTSSDRYAVAVLLHGRMGMVCDIPALKSSRKHSLHHRSNKRRRTGTQGLDRVIFNSSGDSEQPFVFPGIATTSHRSVMWQEADQSPTHSISSGSRQGSISRSSVLSQSRLDKGPTEQSASEATFASTIPIENGPRSLYRNICSADDPPRSVAICPQRRCVAFGCSTGIELHWVDALTGQDLNRWFPLTSPSDFLYFLPPRKNVDSAKKLRLISSAARPCERSAISSRVVRAEAQASTFWQRLGWDLEPGCQNGHETSMDHIRDGDRYFSRHSRRGKLDNSNHFRAIPISDGYHILFTDPASGSLCLGSDAPIGGPTKLLRKIWFQGPSNMTPLIYASGSDLSWGVRVAVVYGDNEQQTLWFFSVPLDIFSTEHSTFTNSTSTFKYKPSYNEHQNMEWQTWLDRSNLGHGPSSVGSAAVSSDQARCWPIKICGQKICETSCVVDLSVDSGPEMTLWAFGSNGFATSWRLNDGTPLPHENSVVLPDGTVRARDAEGDIIMDNVAQRHSSASDLVSYDGTTTSDWSASPELDSSPSLYHSNFALPSSSWSATNGRYSFQHLSWTILESGAVNQNADGALANERRIKTDFIARLDVEIH